MATRFSIITDPDEVEKLLPRVVAATNANKNELGFLPRAVYKEQALQGKLWVAVAPNGAYAGHLLFTSAYPDLKITQIYVEPANRRRGLGAQLISELVQFGESHQFIAISARVASDLPANEFWSLQDFAKTRDVPGGRTTGRTISLRVRHLDVPLLFDLRNLRENIEPQRTLEYGALPLLRTPSYALDLNAVFDLIRRRGPHRYLGAVVRAACNGLTQLCITSEAPDEVRRPASPEAGIEYRPHLEFLRQLPTIPPVPEATLQKLVPELRALVFPRRSHDRKGAPQDLSDLKHLAACIHFQLTGFITSERALLRAGPALREAYRLEILSPQEFAEALDDRGSTTLRTLARVKDLEISVEPTTDEHLPAIASLLSMLAVPETERKNFWTPDRPGTNRKRISAWEGDRLVAVAAWDPPTHALPEAKIFLYADEAASTFERLVDHLFEQALRDCCSALVARVHLHHGPEQVRTRRLALQRGFCSSSDRKYWPSSLTKISVSKVITAATWPEFTFRFMELTDLALAPSIPNFEEVQKTGLPVSRSKRITRLEYFAFETLISPGLILYPGRKAVLVPIRQTYADQLLGSFEGQMNLLPAEEALLHVEKAYFRSSRGASKFTKGMPVGFYLSKTAKAIVAMARVTSSSILSTEEIRLTHQRQGVLSSDELDSYRDPHGKLHTFTFDNLIPLERPVGFEHLRNLEIVSAARLVAPEVISSSNYEHIVNLGSQDGDHG